MLYVPNDYYHLNKQKNIIFLLAEKKYILELPLVT